LTLLGEDPKERCALSLERWGTLLEGTNTKERRTFLLRGGTLSLTFLFNCGEIALIFQRCGIDPPFHLARPPWDVHPLSLGNAHLLVI
jgi:hypothetical protein